MAGGRVAAVYCAAFLGFGIAAPAADTLSDVQAIILEAMSEDVEVASDGSFVDTAHSEYRAVNEAGAMRASRVSVFYDSETQQVEIVEAHTLKRDGTKIPVDVATIYEQLPPDNTLAVTSFRVKVLLFPQFSAGDTAVYTVRTKSPKPNFPGAFLFGKYFPRTIAFKDARITITAPKTMALRLETHNVAFSKEERADTIAYTWRMTAPAAKVSTAALVSPLDREPRFFASSLKDFAELGRAYATQAEPQAAVSPKIQALANEITANASGRRDQAKLIYEWVVSHIRYVAIELGRGSFVPHDAGAVIAKGYGDCKDHDVLLRALLKAKGIDAESILINSSNAYTLTEAPSFAQLDHVITFLPDFGIYLDASSPVAQFGVLPLSEYGKPAVRASLKTAGLITMPMPKPGTATIHTKTVQKIDASGTITGTTATTATGAPAIDLRYVGLAVQALGAERAATLQLQSRGFKDGTGKLIEDPLTTLGDSYTVRGDFTVKGWDDILKGDGTIMPGGLRVMAVTGDDIMGPLYGGDDISDEATICTTAKADEDISLELPAGYNFRGKPDDAHVVTPNLTFTAHWTLAGNTLTVHREFSSTVDRPVCSGSLRQKTAAALKQIKKSYDENLQIIRTVEEYSKSLTQAPDDTATLIARGIAYQKAGDHQKAIADFDAALALKPDDSWTLVNRGFSYDKLGQRDRAAEDYTKVIALDANNAFAYGNRGIIYLDQGKTALAVADLDKALSLDPDNEEFVYRRVSALMTTGQQARAIADVTTLITKHPNAWGYAARATAYLMMKNYKSALADADKAIALAPATASHYMMRSTIKHALGDHVGGNLDSAKALKLDPKIVQ